MQKNNQIIRNPHDDIVESEINLLDYWTILIKYRRLVIVLTLVLTMSVAVGSLFMDNIYKSTAVITSADAKEKVGGLSSLTAQFGGLASIAGITMPGSVSIDEIKSLLSSNMLKEKVIKDNNLLPILFSDDWDPEVKAWKQPKEQEFFTTVVNEIVAKVKLLSPSQKPARVESTNPTVWDGIRALDKIMAVKKDMKTNMITVSAEFTDPEMAAKIIDYFLVALTDHMSSEAKRVAKTNKAYLEEQVNRTADPVVRQKITSLLSQQVETMLMAEVKENFAFKTIDRPMIPDRKVKPKRAMMVVLSLIISGFIGMLIAFFLEYLAKMKAANAAHDGADASTGEAGSGGMLKNEAEKRGLGESGK